MANLAKESGVTLDNSQTVSKARFVKYVGALDAETMRSEQAHDNVACDSFTSPQY